MTGRESPDALVVALLERAVNLIQCGRAHAVSLDAVQGRATLCGGTYDVGGVVYDKPEITVTIAVEEDDNELRAALHEALDAITSMMQVSSRDHRDMRERVSRLRRVAGSRSP